MDETPAITVKVLISDAQQAGFSATERLILDWESRGLLAYRTRNSLGYGRGQAPGTWHPVQRELWNVLIDKRPTVKTLTPLLNIPVWLWLSLEEPDEIPTDQIRRALRSWIRTQAKTTRKQAERAARQVVEQFSHPALSSRSHAYTADELAETLHPKAAINENQIKRLESEFDVDNSGRTLGTPDLPLTPRIWAEHINRRINSLQAIPDLSDEELWFGRHVYRESMTQYLQDRPQLAESALPGSESLFTPMTPDLLVNRACQDFTSVLSLYMTPTD